MIYYIYKVRRKQTSIRSSRSALPHRYISWISWNGHRPQRSTSWVSTCAPPCAPAYDEVPHPAVLLLLLSPSRRERKYLLVFPQEKEKHPSSPFSARLSRVALFVLLCPQALRACAHDPSAAGPSRRLLRPSHAGPRHCAANPLTTKKCRLLAQEKHTQARLAYTLLLRPQELIH